MPEVCAIGAGHNVELVAALAQQFTDGVRGVLGKLSRHHWALHQQKHSPYSDVAKWLNRHEGTSTPASQASCGS